MTSVPRIAVMVLALVIAALALFFLPALLGMGRDDDRAAGSPSAGAPASAGATASTEPSPSAAPTPTTYVVKPGDTLSAIATAHGLTLAELVEANRETVPDPDNVQVGDELIIPVPGASGAAGGSPAASPAGSAAASAAP